MHKPTLTFILFVILSASLATSCSTERKIRRSGSPEGGNTTATYSYNDLLISGVSNDGFFIRKLRLVVQMEGNKDSYAANLRKSADGKWLASIQLLGIEVFRVYADIDNVIILDRLGRKAKIMTWESIAGTYGLTYDLLPVMLGDVPGISRQAQKLVSCNNVTEFRSGDIRYGIVADCEIPRAKELTIVRSQTGQTLYLNAEEYGFAEDRPYTSLINVQEKSGAFHLRLFIDDITIAWKGDIDFAIPVSYKIER